MFSRLKDLLGPASRLLTFLPCLYFVAVLPFLAKHQSVDLSLISLLFAVFLLRARGEIPAAREQTHDGRFLTSSFLALQGLLLVSAWFRLSRLDYNGPFMDELLNMEVKNIGNVHFIASDTRFWPMIGHYAEAFWGLHGMRAVTGILGTLSVLGVYLMTQAFTARFLGREERNQAALWSATIFAFSPSALFISNIASHDALALFLFIFAFTTLANGLRGENRTLLVSSAFLFLLSFVSRYFILLSFLSIPLYLRSQGFLRLGGTKDDRVLKTWFLRPLVLFGVLYFLGNAGHVIHSVQLAVHSSGSKQNGDFTIVALAMLLRLLIVCIPLLLLGLLRLVFPKQRTETENDLIKFLWRSFLIYPLIHLVKVSDFGMEKNLSYAVLFGSVLVGIQLASFRRSYLFLPPFLGLYWALLHLLFPLSARNEMRAEEVMARLDAKPQSNLLTALVQADQNRWFDPKPAYDALLRLGLGKQRAAVHGNFGGTHINWYLTHWMGRQDDGKEYYVSPGTAWKPDTFLYASTQRIPVLLAIIPEAQLHPFERLRDYPNYRYEGAGRIPEAAGNYGRVFVFVDPAFLDASRIPPEHREYYQTEIALSSALPEAIDKLDRPGAQALLNSANDLRERLREQERKFALSLDIAEGFAAMGESKRAKEEFLRASELGKELSPPEEYEASIETRRKRLSSFRIRPDAGERDFPYAKAENLLPRGKKGETPQEDIPRSTGKSLWYDFEPPLELPADSILRLELNLQGGNILAVRFVESNQDYGEKGSFLKLPFLTGQEILYLPNPKARSIKRIDLQMGPDAWGPLGGTMKAEANLSFFGVLPGNWTLLSKD